MKNNSQKYKPTEGTSSIVMDSQGHAINAASPRLNSAIITYQISRLEIEKCITRRIVHDLRAEPKNPLVTSGMDSVLFSVEGYDDDPRELFMISEFRRYIKKVHEYHPAWIYYASLGSKWLPTVALCLLKNATVVTDTRLGKNRIAFPGQELSDFMRAQLDPFFALCEMAGVPPEDAEKRVRDVCESFGMEPKSERTDAT